MGPVADQRSGTSLSNRKPMQKSDIAPEAQLVSKEQSDVDDRIYCQTEDNAPVRTETPDLLQDKGNENIKVITKSKYEHPSRSLVHKNGEIVTGDEVRDELKCKSALDESETRKYTVTGGNVPVLRCGNVSAFAGAKRKDSGLTPKTSYSQILVASQSAYK